jgi:hypothetical protein
MHRNSLIINKRYDKWKQVPKIYTKTYHNFNHSISNLLNSISSFQVSCKYWKHKCKQKSKLLKITWKNSKFHAKNAKNWEGIRIDKSK